MEGVIPNARKVTLIVSQLIFISILYQTLILILFFFLQVESKTASPANKRKPREVDLESENQAVDSFMWGGHGGRGRYGGYGNSIVLKGIIHIIRQFLL